MRHFIAYHNPDKMGYPYTVAENGTERFLSNKPVGHLLGNYVWVVTFKADHDYSLASVFQVTDTGDAQAEGFKHYVSGTGHLFRPWHRIKGEDWFPKLLKTTGNFGLGLQEVSDPFVVAGLLRIAQQDKCELRMWSAAGR